MYPDLPLPFIKIHGDILVSYASSKLEKRPHGQRPTRLGTLGEGRDPRVKKMLREHSTVPEKRFNLVTSIFMLMCDKTLITDLPHPSRRSTFRR
jgi:hypothetical protein